MIIDFFSFSGELSLLGRERVLHHFNYKCYSLTTRKGPDSLTSKQVSKHVFF